MITQAPCVWTGTGKENEFNEGVKAKRTTLATSFNRLSHCVESACRLGTCELLNPLKLGQLNYGHSPFAPLYTRAHISFKIGFS